MTNTKENMTQDINVRINPDFINILFLCLSILDFESAMFLLTATTIPLEESITKREKIGYII